MYCGAQSAVDRLPRLAAVIGAEGAGRRDRDEDPFRIAGIENDGVQAHSARARLPFGAGAVAAQSGEFLPVLAAVGRAEQGGVFDSGVDRVRIGKRRLQMPDALELPGMRRAVVPLVSAGDAVVGELVAHRLPGLAAVIGALDHLPEPAAAIATRTADSGSAGDPLSGKISQPAKCGPLTSHFSRLPSEVRMNAPLRVPTRTRTLLMLFSLIEGRLSQPWSKDGGFPMFFQLAFLPELWRLFCALPKDRWRSPVCGW